MALAIFALAAASSSSRTDWDASSSALIPFWVIALSPLLILVDLHRRHELTLLHNLGIATPVAVLAAVAPVVLLEGALVLAFMSL